MTPEQQLDFWCEGKSIHNEERNECCPDFSCCVPEINTPREQRILFRDRPELRDEMLQMFLAQAFESMNIHVAGSIRGVA